jgi:hypothetical protein
MTAVVGSNHSGSDLTSPHEQIRCVLRHVISLFVTLNVIIVKYTLFISMSMF